jgi:poly-gamma-glutamate synthesis protein (capsule biosynthesis protein)
MVCGDVMLGRGIDQILPHPSPPVIYEDYVRSALDYVALAERANGPIPRAVPLSYVWGDALDELERRKPDLRIINLETAVTGADRPEPKGINYRMSPDNVGCLSAAGVDCCVLANNHVLDWRREGLLETLDALVGRGIKTAGAGRDAAQAEAPAVLDAGGKARVLVYGVACRSSGVPAGWAARPEQPGVNLIGEPSDKTARQVSEQIARNRKPGDIVVLSIHWGGNWGYDVPAAERVFARRLVESGQVDAVHGHSSHHFKTVEMHRGKPILYGCGDFLNDYEGIGGYEDYRSDLVLMYLLTISCSDGKLLTLEMVPFRIRNFRLNRVDRADAEWVARRMDEQCRRFGGSAALGRDNSLSFAQLARGN